MSHDDNKRGRLPRRGDVKAQIATNIVNSIAGIIKTHRSRSASPATPPLESEENVWPADPVSGSLLSPLLVKNQQ
ncbi:hypothetical protein MPTK1_7g01350 [Marchantia polymorpha subsp. ruderalis]|uniref:Uncharacterized protein n=1 Tax=Marchantia polymorpha subsp. ruderalis TaxID=1480154 RepID=A0AAF6BV07_MARPO|nr:hypothetical protein Mp_7g01350 [Marchantia polymorpha subsp. ruderalis]